MNIFRLFFNSSKGCGKITDFKYTGYYGTYTLKGKCGSYDWNGQVILCEHCKKDLF